jgi:hypothetical protein
MKLVTENFEKIIEFDSLDVAEKVVSYLHQVEIDITGNRPLLKFTKFDGAAFNLALALEGVESTGWKILSIVKPPQFALSSRDWEAIFSPRDYIHTNYVCTIAAVENVDIITGGLLTIQDTTLCTGDRVLLTAQTDRTENGLYLADLGPWVRAEIADVDTRIVLGMTIFVIGGNLNSGTVWTLTTPDPIVLGVTDLTFCRVCSR